MQIIPALLKYGDFSQIGSLIAPRPCVWEMGSTDGLLVKDGWDEKFKARLEKIYAAYGARDQLHYDHLEGGHRWNGDFAFPLFDTVLRGAKRRLSATTSTTRRDGTGRPQQERPDDRRLGTLHSTDDSEFPMQPMTDATAWPAHREEIRTRILVAAGLHPLPKRTPLGAVVHGKVEREEYTVERVIFESFPGHYVTGSLYRPKAPAAGKRPAVLSPYGHWKEGRFHDHGLEQVRKEIAGGAERFEVGGRHVIQARCVQLARMGCVVFVYDMEGFADSVQFADHWTGPRPDDSDPAGYPLLSPRAELHGQTPFGLQTWNSIRALDFVCSLEDVDPDRIAVTGASGGGTQSMILGAVDDRIAASMPAVMVSSAGQGGCTCENAQYLRIGQGNVDIAAATAPRPLGLICANDWTRALKADGHPQLKALYKLLGCPDRYEAHFHFEFRHNYNAVNRQHMYHFMNRHLKLGLPEPIVERDYRPLNPVTEATVWTDAYPKPGGHNVGLPHERKLTAVWAQATAAALAEMSENDRRALIAQGITTMVGRTPEDVGPVEWEPAPDVDGGDTVLKPGLLTVTAHGEQLPVLLLFPKRNWNRDVVVRLTDTGKAGILGADGVPIAEVLALVKDGSAVAAIDLFGQGDFVKGGNALESVRVIPRGKGEQPYQRAACYHFGYNPPLLIQRVHDVMSLVEFLRREDGERKPERIHLTAVGKQVGPVALIARFALGERIDKVTVDPQEFSFDSVDRIDHPMFLPGILRYGGMDALWKLNQLGPAAGAAGLRAAFVDELRPLYPDSRIEEAAMAEPVRIDAARGTIAGVHILLRDVSPDASLQVEAAGSDGWPAAAVRFYHLLDVPVEINSGLHSRTEKWDGKRNPYVIRRAPFRIFEVLKPFEAQARAGAAVVALAVQVDTIPRDAKPGDYPLQIAIRIGSERTEKRLILRVHAATVPPAGKDTLRVTNWYSEGNMLRGTEAAPGSEASWEILDRYAAMMAKGRQNTFRLPLWLRSDARGRIVLDEQRTKRLIALFERHGFYYVEGCDLVKLRGGRLATRLGSEPVQSTKGTAELVETLACLREFIAKEKLQDRWLQHIKDEPGGTLTGDYKFVADLVHKHLPRVPVLEATVTRELAGAVDIWCPTVDQYQRHRDFFERRRKQGDRCWVYTCLTPTGPWVNRLIDMERLRPVYIGWGAACFGTTGYLHWGLNRFVTDPFQQSVVDHPAAPHSNNQLPAGDTHILYPGPGCPWSSTRFEAQRIGLEDRELLRQLDVKDPALCRQIIASVFRGYDDYETDVRAYRDARRKLFEVLDVSGCQSAR